MSTRSGVLLVDDVSLSGASGEIVGVVGETGAGKTLTMRAALGLLPPGVRATGQLVLAERTLELADTRALQGLLGRQTGVVLQNPGGMLDPLVRVGDQLVEGVVELRIMSTADARGRAAALLAQMGFADPEAVQRLYPHELSGGMAQRVATAMGMMPRPRLLVLDEPTSALDANVRVEVLRLFRQIAVEEGTTVFLVSHDLGLVSHFCDSIAVMYAGRVVEQGETRGVLAQPTHPYTEALLACSATLDAPRRTLLSAIPGAPPAPGRWPSGCVFRPRCPYAFDRCAAERPVLRPCDDGQAACHRPRSHAA